MLMNRLSDLVFFNINRLPYQTIFKKNNCFILEIFNDGDICHEHNLTRGNGSYLTLDGYTDRYWGLMSRGVAVLCVKNNKVPITVGMFDSLAGAVKAIKRCSDTFDTMALVELKSGNDGSLTVLKAINKEAQLALESSTWGAICDAMMNDNLLVNVHNEMLEVDIDDFEYFASAVGSN
ncbi:hypothetical protein A3715_15240 [Oleiphilus sp. HI0009]|nr:hypothetical protein A3715_15240 [Oleiphilus sp. HI0009]